jgi:hypothetical protein
MQKEINKHNKNQQYTRCNDFEKHKIPSGYVGVTEGKENRKQDTERER